MVTKLKKFWLQIRNRALVWDTITTTGWSTVGKGVGFLVPFFIAAWFGVTAETDAFFFAYGLILFFSMLFAPVVEGVIVPYVAEARSKKEDVGKFVGRILGVSGIGLLGLAGIVLLVIKPVLSIITRFDLQSLDLIYLILLQTAPLIIFLVWTSILAGTLNAYKKFAFPAISPAFRAMVNIGFIFAFKDILGIHAIALGYVLGEIVRLGILVAAIRGFKLFKLSLSFKLSSKLKEFLKTASYQTIGMAAIGLNPIVDRTMASWLGEGSVSVLYYADRLYMIPIVFFGSGLLVTILSHWSAHYQNFGRQRLNNDVKKAVKIVVFTVLPIALLLILFHQPIVNLAFGRGEFSQESLIEVGRVWVFYLLGIAFYIIKQLFVRGHIVLKNTKVLMKGAFYAVILNIIFNYFLMKPLQTAGIALATTIVSIFTLVYFSSRFFKKEKCR